MANVKITDLTELAAIDVADNDVVPIVDVGGDTTKKITIESLKNATAAANDFVTFTRLNANINVVQDNVASLSTEDTALQARIDANALVAASNVFITFTQLNANINLVQDNVASISVDTASGTEARLNANLDIVQDNVASIDANVVSIVDTGGHTVTFSANLIPSADGVYDLGSATNKWKDLHLTGSSIKLGGITISSLGDEGITIIGTSGEQANVVAPQLGGAANVSANIATLQAHAAATDTRLGANITLLTNEDTALQARLDTNVTAFTNEDTALQARLDTNVTAFTNEDTALQARLDTNVTAFTNEDTALQARLDTNVTAFTNEDTALQARLDTNVTAFTNEDTALQARLDTNVTAFTNEDTALQARLDTNVTAFTNEDTALQARIAANTLVAASNDFITFTQLNANINLVQDNVASISVDTASGTEARLNANLDVVQDNVASIDANVVSIVDTGGHTVTFSANVIPSADGVYDLGSATNKWKDLHLTGSSIKLGGITISSLGDEGITIIGTSGEQANVVTPQLGGAANVSANIATLEANVASTDTRLGANITLLTNEDTALQARLDTNVTAFTNEDTALQARLDTNVTAFTNEDTALQARLDTNVTAFTNEDTALQARIDANALVAASNDFITFTQLNANINLVQDNVASISVDTAAGTEARLNANLDIVQDNVASIDANVVSIVDTGGHTVTFSANLIPSADGVYDLGSATNKWKDLHLTGSSIKLGGITISSLGDEGITIIGTSGEQANVVAPQLGGAANVSANIATLQAHAAA